MTFPAIIALAFALALDAFAVALAAGLRLGEPDWGATLRMAGAFGLFQFLMPVAGWFAGIQAHAYIAAYAHWLAFALLAFVGGSMLREAWSRASSGQERNCAPDPTKGRNLLLLSVATSLDALAVGLSFAALDTDVWTPALVIGVVCFGLTAVGMHASRLICGLPWIGKAVHRAQAAGGLILFAIGFRILHEHGVFS